MTTPKRRGRSRSRSDASAASSSRSRSESNSLSATMDGSNDDNSDAVRKVPIEQSRESETSKGEPEVENKNPTIEVDISKATEKDEPIQQSAEKAVTTPSSRSSRGKVSGANKSASFTYSSISNDIQFLNKKQPKNSKSANHVVVVEKNELSKLIPGYTAPLRLTSSTLSLYQPKGGLEELRRRAVAEETSKWIAPISGYTTQSITSVNTAAVKTTTSFAAAVSSFKTGKRKPMMASLPDAGDGWFGMKSTPLTEDVKRDIALVRNRNYLDPKRFYKSSDQPSKVLQIGTVVEGFGEFYTSRLTKKQRRTNITEEIMADPKVGTYALKKFHDMERSKQQLSDQRRKRHGKKGKGFKM